jgi:hypothetical protein
VELFDLTIILVNSRIFEWNTLKADLFSLYNRLVDLGMEYHNGHVRSKDLEP